MAIYEGSRFSINNMQQVVDADGQALRVHRLCLTTDTDKATPYVTRVGDTFESLAAKFYGNSNSWWVIAKANPEIFYPLDLKAKTQIKIPSILKARN